MSMSFDLIMSTARCCRQGIAAFIASGYPLAFRLSNGEILLDANYNSIPALPALGPAPAPAPGRRRLKLASTGAGQALMFDVGRSRQHERRRRALLQLTDPGARSSRSLQPASRQSLLKHGALVHVTNSLV